MDHKSFLTIQSITKKFPGVLALDAVSLSIAKGSVHALLGENGAGKSTLIKILAGIYPPDKGDIYLEGQKQELQNIRYSQSLGISVIHQELCLVPELSVAQNIFLGREKQRFLLDDTKLTRQAETLIEEFGFSIRPDDIVSTLSIAKQQMVEIVRALSINIKVIVMDEPTASISAEDSQKLFTIIKKLQKKGISVVYVSHRMEEIFQIADTVTVLRDGKHINTSPVHCTDRAKLVEMMVGRNVEEIFHYNIENTGNKLLELKNINNKSIKNINIDLNKGEILGISGLVGSGRTEIANVIFGIDKYTGDIIMGGTKVSIHSPNQAMNMGIALIPENRKEQGLILGRSIADNMLLLIVKKIIRGIFKNKKRAQTLLNEYVAKLRIKVSSLESEVSTLSGGNQQKVVLAKWLKTNPEILILDEPTRGIDVGAKFEIYDLLFKLIEQGISIILISSELAEIVHLCTRVVVMNEGRIVGRLQREELSSQNIMSCIMQQKSGRLD